jgi:ribose transport system permease protein
MSDDAGPATGPEPATNVSDLSAAAPRWGIASGKLPDELGIFVALIVLGGFIGIASPSFLTQSSLLPLIRSSSFYGIMALGMVFLLALGDIDLSIGSSFYFVAVVTALMLIGGIDPWLAAALGVAFGALLGLVNAGFSILLRVPVIIITLGTLSAFRGLGLVVSGAQDLVITDQSSPFFTVVSSKVLGIVPVPVIIFLGLVVLLHALLHYTAFGYRVQAIGSNPEAARLVGIPIAKTRLQVLVLMGLLSGVAGVMFIGFFGAVDASVGQGYELLVISSVIIGGTSLAGGSGSIIGALIGVLIIAVISSGIVHLGVQDTWSGFVTGAVIIAAVALDRLVRHRQSRRTARVSARQ